MDDPDMQTAELIDSLTQGVAPVRSTSTLSAIAPAMTLGAAGTMIGVLTGFDVQPGLDAAAMRPLLMKLAYAGSLGAVALTLVLALARPGQPSIAWRWLLLPALPLAALAIAQAGNGDGARQWLGSSWTACSLRILILSAPIFVALVMAMRRQAPTDLRRAGGAIGLTSGALAACLYALACTESSAAFVLVWYSLGIAAPAVLGCFFGPRLLRW